VFLFFFINIMGTYYYMHIPHDEREYRSVGLLTVLIGWFGFFPANLYSGFALSNLHHARRNA